MSLVIHLLGRPRVESTRGEPYRFRSRKSWPLLAYLLLAERPRSRAQLAGLIFAKAQTYLGSVASDRGDYPRAVGLLVDAQRNAQPRPCWQPTSTTQR